MKENNAGVERMQKRLQGLVIRKQRQERGWSQRALCTGICAVSYLSKIEQGKAEGSPEVLSLLFRRLDITWREDPAFCRESGAWFQEQYDRLFTGESMEDQREILLRRGNEYRNSPYLLDWLMLTWAITRQMPEDPNVYLPVMDAKQHCLYLCLTGQFQQLLRMSDRAYFLLEAGRRAYWKGNYAYAMDCLRQGADRAGQEGSLPVMMRCRLVLGNCCSNLRQLDQALEHYAVASRMARSLGAQEELTAIAYNRATTEFQMGLTEDALRHLLDNPWDDGLYYRMLALCHERLGHRQEALQTLQRAQDAPLEGLPGYPSNQREIFDQMCQVIRIRLEEPDYLRNPAYGNLLRTCIRNQEQYLSAGFAQFQSIWLEQWYAANRQYRQAYEISKQMKI